MKKVLAILVVLASIITLSACGKDNTPAANSSQPTTSTDGTNDSTPNIQPTDVTENNTANNIAGQNIYSALNYTEGYAFVKLNDYDSPLICIDKKGNINFELAPEYYPASDFHNGLAVMRGPGGIDVLCNTKGEIITAEDLGGTSFDLPAFDTDGSIYQMFKDGYILITKTTADFAGSKTELAVMDHNLNTIVDYSEEFYNYYNNNSKFHGYDYYNGFVYDAPSELDDNLEYLDLRTGEVNASGTLSDFYANLSVAYPSDFWYDYYSKIYDSRTGEMVIDMSQYDETLHYLIEFENGLAPLFFESNTGNGLNCYFTLLDEDGNFKFDPVQVEWGARLNGGDSYRLYESNGKYLVMTAKTPETYSYAIFDSTGLLLQTDEATASVYVKGFSDDVIQAYADGREVYYSSDFKPLF